MTDKHIVIIASAGRTGTTFFGDKLSDMIEDCFSVHEPDIFSRSLRKTWKSIKDFGFYHVIPGRFFGQTGIRNLSKKFLSGQISLDELIPKVRQHREKYYSAQDENLIIESYARWYGILPAIKPAFPKSKVIGITRDPRTWVQSAINHLGHHSGRDPVVIFGSKRLEPAMINDKTYAARWNEMSVFEKNCWDWQMITNCLKSYANKGGDIKAFRYEDLFLSPEREKYLEEMLRFITTFEDRKFSYTLNPGILNSIKNASKGGDVPSWHKWPQEMCLQLEKICGPLMREYGYGLEEEWNEKLKGF